MQGKTAIITGAGSGMGRATALLFAREGARVLVADINEAAAGETVAAIAEAGGEAVAFRADVTRAAEIQAMIEEAVRRWGKLDILMNNAGIPMSFTPVEEVTEAQFDRLMNINVKGVFLGVKYGAPVMKAQGGGVIINTASTAGIRPRPGLTPYNASKGAVITMTKSLALELAPAGIRVNAICPVATDTPMLDGFIGDRFGRDEGREKFRQTIPLGRLCTAEDIAQAALYLAKAPMVTGVALEVDGGRDI
ncbi:MAG TPA: SDR family oxidoreductase [Symbiobacteriaceae bacterium]